MNQTEDYSLLPQVVELVMSMEFFPNYPRTEKGLTGYARGVCRLIQKQIKCDTLESCRLLVERAIDTCDKMPSVLELDELYRGLGFRPADQGPIPKWAFQDIPVEEPR